MPRNELPSSSMGECHHADVSMHRHIAIHTPGYGYRTILEHGIPGIPDQFGCTGEKWRMGHCDTAHRARAALLAVLHYRYRYVAACE